MSVCEATVARLCREGRLPRVKGVRHILIPVSFLEGWVKDNTVYTSEFDQNSKSGEHSWIVESKRKASTLTEVSGGPLTQMEAAKELEDLLAAK